jgi:hypothetical protein
VSVSRRMRCWSSRAKSASDVTGSASTYVVANAANASQGDRRGCDIACQPPTPNVSPAVAASTSPLRPLSV